jgi:hypothetical protein
MPIGGINDTPQGAVAAGAAAQPLVTSADPSVVGPQAVQNLVDSFRQGFITGNDIMDRIGAVGQAKRKAELEQLGEYVDPQFIEARKSAAAAQTAQNQLQLTQAQASTGNVQALADYQKQQAQWATANLGDKAAIDAYTMYNRPLKKADGSYDFDQMADLGTPMKGAAARYQYAVNALQVGDIKNIPGGPGQRPQLVYLDKNGAPMTDKSRQAAYDQLEGSWAELHNIDASQRGKTPALPYSGPPPAAMLAPAAPAATSLVQPLSTSTAAPVGGVVQVTTPVTTGGTAEAPVPQFMQGAQVPYGYAQGTSPPEIQERVTNIRNVTDKSPEVENYAKAQQYITPFEVNASRVAQMTPAQQQSATMGVLDQSMLENLIKMYDPQGVMREFKWDKLEENQNRLETYLNFGLPGNPLKNVIQKVEGKTILTPLARQRLIDQGYEVINGMQSSAQNRLNDAQKFASSVGLPDPYATNDNLSFVAKGGRSKNPVAVPGDIPPAGGASAARAGGTPPVSGAVQTTVGGKTVWWQPGTRNYWQ